MEGAVMCDEGVMGSEPLSIREQMVNAAKKYLGSPVDLPDNRPIKELVIKLEPCDILVTAPFVNSAYVQPPRIYKTRQQTTIPPKLQTETETLKMKRCEVLGCGFRTPKSAMLDKHMTYHLNESFVLTMSKNLRGKLKPLPVESECKTEKPSGSKMEVSESIGDVFKKILSKTCMAPETETSLVKSYPTPGQCSLFPITEETNQARSNLKKSEDIARYEDSLPIVRSESDARISNTPSGAVLDKSEDLKDIADNNPSPDDEMFWWMDDVADPGYNSITDPDYKPESDDPKDRSHDLMSDKQKTLTRKKLEKKKVTRKFIYRCTDCDFTTKRRQEFTGHVNIHRGTFIECEVQGCAFKTPHPEKVRTHFIRVHERDRTAFVMCHLCGKEISKYSFNRHMRVIHGPKDALKKYKCKFCDFTSICSVSVRRHELIHTGVKQYQCPHCDYSSNQKCNLETHMRRHSGNKPYKCPECDYSAAHNVTLKGHIRANHPEYNVS